MVKTKTKSCQSDDWHVRAKRYKLKPCFRCGSTNIAWQVNPYLCNCSGTGEFTYITCLDCNIKTKSQQYLMDTAEDWNCEYPQSYVLLEAAKSLLCEHCINCTSKTVCEENLNLGKVSFNLCKFYSLKLAIDITERENV